MPDAAFARPVGARRGAYSCHLRSQRRAARSLQRIATARPRPLTLPQSRAPTAAARVPRRRAAALVNAAAEGGEEKAPASASERIQHFVSNLTVADAARYGTCSDGSGVYMVSKGVLGAINTLPHLPPTTVAKYGFYSGFLVASATAVAIRHGLARDPHPARVCLGRPSR